MELTRDHIIHSRGGKVGENASTLEDASRIANQAFKAGRVNGIALHFHGGLVSQTAAEGIANRLGGRYEGANTYPIFFVWESGFIESIRNNLKDVLQDKVFHELVKKASEWVLKKGTSEIVTRGSGTTIDVDRLRRDFDLWFSGQSIEPPVKNGPFPPQAVTRNIGLDEEELTNEIFAELELDPTFENTIAGLAVADHRVPIVTTRGVGINPLPVNILVDSQAMDEMFPREAHITRGGISWIAVARFVAKIIIATIRRYANNTDHGPYTTIVEEVLRAAYLDKVGQVIWNQMKKDADQDAFNMENAVGEVVLQSWKQCIDAGTLAPRVTLIGHSTGAIFINAWIKRSAELIPSLTYDVILLAPACRTEEYVNLITRHGGQINNMRMFAMKDEVEQQDRLVSIIYPRSLLYFVSGVVEGGVDVPLLGMQRFLKNLPVFNVPYLEAAREYFSNNERAIWSIARDVPGNSCSSLSHGDFDNDLATLDSISHILNGGY